MVLLDKLTIGYPDHPVVDSLSLTMREGDRIGFAGESGSGKTTLLSTIAGLRNRNAHVSGEVKTSGRIGYIPQEATHSLSPYLRLVDQVSELAKSRSEASRLLDSVGIGQRQQQSYPHQVSGGERQRVLVVQALALQPGVILADEPTANLDERSEQIVLDRIDTYLKERNATLVIASHQPAVFEKLQCHIHQLSPAREHMLLGPPEPVGLRDDFAVRVDHLTKTYSHRDFVLRSRPVMRALRDVSLSIRPAETIALVGPSGSGKSTLARCLAHRERWDSGEITLRKAGVQLVQQEPSESINPGWTLSRVLQEASPRSGPDLLERIGLPAKWIGRRATELSEGQRARVAIARSIAAVDGGLLILDESFAGLDPETISLTVRYMRDVQHRTGMSCLVITHRMELARQISHRTIQIEDGSVAG